MRVLCRGPSVDQARGICMMERPEPNVAIVFFPAQTRI